MLIATSATHSGASGGALLDAQGRLAAIITSNARHASGVTLPHMAFCIAAAELAPVMRWAAGQQLQLQQLQRGAGALDVSGLRALDVYDADAARWAGACALRPALGAVAKPCAQGVRAHSWTPWPVAWQTRARPLRGPLVCALWPPTALAPLRSCPLVWLPGRLTRPGVV